MGNVTRRLLCGALVLGLAAAVLGSPLTDAVSALSDAVAARVAALAGEPKGSPGQKEAKSLTKAGKALSRFPGTVDVLGARVLVKAGKGLAKSGTADPATLAAVVDVLDCAVQELDAQEGQLEAAAEILFAPSEVERFQAFLADARAELAAATDPTTPPDQALAALQRALALYGKAARFVAKVQARQQAERPPKVSFDLTVRNFNGKTFTIQKLEFDLFFLPQGGGAPVRVLEDFRDHQDPASGFVLPYVMKGTEAEFEIFPTLKRAVESVVGPGAAGALSGVIHFKSTKHGKAQVPVDPDEVFIP